MRNAKRTTAVLVGCALMLAAGRVSAQDWPQWRGPNRDNKVVGFNEPKEWPKTLTKKWKTTVGQGDSSPVLAGDKVYTLESKDKTTLDQLDKLAGLQAKVTGTADKDVIQVASVVAAK